MKRLDQGTLTCALTILLLASCTEVFEEDLDESAVVLLTPPAGHVTTINEIEFRWEEVPHALEYKLQVAGPDFISPMIYELDTVISSIHFTWNFSPGAYQWRVRAQNGSSHTDYYTRAFTIESTEDLTGQVPILVTPAQGTTTSAMTITFDWDTLPFTDDHRFVLHLGDQSGALVEDLIVPGSETTLSAIADGEYTWGVQAQNAVPSVSEFSYRNLTVDATPPSNPLQLLPAAGAMLPDGTFTFTWQSGVDALTSTMDSLLVKDGALQVVRAVGGLNGTYADSLGAGSYIWIVRTVDQAGNSSSAGPISFTVP